VLLALAAPTAQAHWPSTNATKWVEFPDSTYTGLDMWLNNQSPNQLTLADDFKCILRGPITDIHLWTSWINNVPDPNAIFTLSIWSDVPASGTLPSHPGSRQWTQIFGPGKYQVQPWLTDVTENFWNPDPSPGMPMGPDYAIYQYNFYPTNPFVQSGTLSVPRTYWLAVSVTGATQPIGWKTSTNQWHDASVFSHMNGTNVTGDWHPILSPYFGTNLDLSFALTTGVVTNPPPPAETNMVKYVQLPCLTSVGDPNCPNCICLELNASGPIWLADDFLCTNAGPVTDIHLWGSWLNDVSDPSTFFMLSIFSDVPATVGVPGSFSQPGDMLWSAGFAPGQYVATPVHWPDAEGFFDPATQGFLGMDYVLWRYDFYVDTNAFPPFVQEGSPTTPTNYWLAVNAGTQFYTNLFGWKISTNHYADAAVFSSGGPAGPWELPQIPTSGGTGVLHCDLAFVLTTQPPPPTCDFGDAPDSVLVPRYPTLLVHNGARHTVVPGVLLGNLIDIEADGQPNATATGDDLAGLPDEDGVIFNTNPLMPGQWATVQLTASVNGFLNAWVDFNANGSWADAGEAIFVNQPVNAGVNFLNFLVPPTATDGTNTFARFRYTTYLMVPPAFTGLASDGEVEDYIIGIAAPPGPPPPPPPQTNAVKYLQWPDTNGLDVLATTPILLADDYLCTNTGPVTDIHFWCSWLGDYWSTNATFWLGIWSDSPSSSGVPSHPSTLLWSNSFSPDRYGQYFATNANELFYNPQTTNFLGADHQMHYYSFYPTNPFVQTGSLTVPVVYWLSVQASLPTGELFGWKTSTNHWNDDAVYGVTTLFGSGLVASWAMDEGSGITVHDSTVYANHGSFVGPAGGQPTWTTGHSSSWALAFPGGDYQTYGAGVSVPHSASLNITGPFAIQAWIKADPGQHYYAIVDKMYSSWGLYARGYTFYLTGGALRVSVYPGTGSDGDVFGATDLRDSQWHLVEGGFDGSSLYVKVDGRLDGRVAWTSPPASINTPLGIGERLCGWGGYLSFKGVIDSVIITTNSIGSWQWTELRDPRTGQSLDLAFKLTTVSNQCLPPTLTCTNLTVECGSTVSPPFAWDNCCNTNVTPVLTGSVTNGACPWVITQTWQATDCRGQTSSCTRLVTNVDTTPPVITCATNITVQCGTAWNFTPPTASDACCGTNVTVTVSSTSTNGACPWVISRIWKALDCCNNFSTCTQTVTVVDTIPPTVSCSGNKTVNSLAALSFDLPTISDSCCGTNYTLSFYDRSNSPCPLTVMRTWVVANCCSLSNACSQTVTVVLTNTPPADTNILKYVQWPKTVGGYDVYDRTVIFLADDFPCTNTGPISDIHVWCSYLNDMVTNPPIWLGIWSDVPALGTNISHPGQLLWQQIFMPDQYQQYFWGCGAEQYFIPSPSPFIYGPDSQVYYSVFYTTNGFVQQGTPANPTNYWLSVYCPDTNNPWFGWKTATNVYHDTAVWNFWPPGVSTNWTAVKDPYLGTPLDLAFKITTSTNQCAPPSITCNNLTVECGSQVSPPFAYDNCCNTALTPVLTGSVTNGMCPWIITETWKATDCRGQTNSCTRQVKVVDTPPPVITCAPNITVQCGSTWNFTPPTASDACCGTNVAVTVSSTSTNGTCPWVIRRIWKALDCCTNFSTCTQTVTVVDTTPPSITCVPNKTVTAGSAWIFDPPTATDICCGTNLTVGILNTVTSSPCPLTMIRTWVVTNCCSLTNMCSQTVTVLNTNTPPADTNMVKFVQWPKTIGGYDVYDRTVLFLADDFRCTNTGPITDIHIWCSYSNDEVSNPPIWLSIWSDVPTGPTNNYSHPGQLLWQQSFTPDKYQRYFWGCGAEKFYMPWGSGFYGPDSQVYYYVFYPTNAFVQQGTPQSPATYWLSVYCLDNSFFGWKTSTNAFQDAAVWAFWPPSSANTWSAMTDPDFGGPLNMAFKITTSTNQPPVPTVTTKFIQYPDRSTNGLDVRATQPKILADDFKCIRTGPIRGVTLWASWLNDQVDPNAQFLLGLWTDVPARGNQPSHPGVLITNTWFYPPGNPNQSLLRYRYQRFATAQEKFFDPNTSQIIGPDTQIWQYDFFPTVWKEAGMPFAPKTYWLSVTANANTNLYLFGWKTSTNRWGDDAVFGHVNSAWQPLNDWLELRDPRNSVSLNQAFAIKTFDIYHLNKDFYNQTHLVADTFEIVLLGTYDVTWHYDDFVHTAWPNFTVVYSGGTTILRWSGGAVGPGQMTHVGFEVPYVCPPVQLLATRWLAGGVIIGSPIQVNFQRTATTVQFLNTVFTPPSPMYLGNATIEYYPDAQPLDQLNPDTIRTPIRTDIIIPPGPVETIPVGGTDIHPVPPPPPGATYAVHVFQVSTNETLTTGATTDFVQMPLDNADPPIITWIEVGSGTATIWWTSIPCRTYRLVATTNVETPLASWTSMGDIPAGSDVTSLSMMVPIDSLSRQFYRVELLPVTP
jgi:hypothetical protein